MIPSSKPLIWKVRVSLYYLVPPNPKGLVPWYGSLLPCWWCHNSRNHCSQFLQEKELTFCRPHPRFCFPKIFWNNLRDFCKDYRNWVLRFLNAFIQGLILQTGLTACQYIRVYLRDPVGTICSNLRPRCVPSPQPIKGRWTEGGEVWSEVLTSCCK